MKAAGTGLLAGLSGAVGSASAAPTAVDLGKEGLSPGDDVDPYLEEHFTSGTEVYVPPGEYTSEFGWWGTEVSDATLRGDPAGVRLRRPEGLTYEEDDGSDVKIDETLAFDGHVVVENVTLKGRHGWQQNRLDVEGRSDDAHLEIRNFNAPDGAVGNSDTIVGRSYGSGRVDYTWCYFANFPNTCFYQLESGRDVRQVFDGCVFRNVPQAHRGGTRDYTVRNCIYVADGPLPSFCEEEDAPCDGDGQGGIQRPFKMDQGFGWEGTFENLHFYAGSGANVSSFLDFQDEQSGISGTMDGLYLHNETDAELFDFDWDVGSSWDIRNVHLTGPGNLSVPDSVGTASDPREPVRDVDVWTPDGEGIGTV